MSTDPDPNNAVFKSAMDELIGLAMNSKADQAPILKLLFSLLTVLCINKFCNNYNLIFFYKSFGMILKMIEII